MNTRLHRLCARELACPSLVIDLLVVSRHRGRPAEYTVTFAGQNGSLSVFLSRRPGRKMVLAWGRWMSERHMRRRDPTAEGARSRMVTGKHCDKILEILLV